MSLTCSSPKSSSIIVGLRQFRLPIADRPLLGIAFDIAHEWELLTKKYIGYILV